MSKLIEFLDALDSDAAFRDSYSADPAGKMKDFGLTSEESTAIMNSDVKSVKKLAGLDDNVKIILGVLSYKPQEK